MAIALLFAASAVISTLAAHLAPITIPARASAVTAEVNLAAARQHLLTTATDRTRDIVLDLDGIEAEQSPAVYFEVYIHARNAPRGRTVGNLALFGSGIRSEARDAFRPAHLQLVITDELRAALRKSSTVAITFVARGAGGSAPLPRSASALTIARPSILFVPRTRE